MSRPCIIQWCAMVCLVLLNFQGVCNIKGLLAWSVYVHCLFQVCLVSKTCNFKWEEKAINDHGAFIWNKCNLVQCFFKKLTVSFWNHFSWSPSLDSAVWSLCASKCTFTCSCHGRQSCHDTCITICTLNFWLVGGLFKELGSSWWSLKTLGELSSPTLVQSFFSDCLQTWEIYDPKTKSLNTILTLKL